MTARTIDFQYVIMRGAADLTTIEPVEGGEPTLRCDDKGDVPMSLSGQFIPNDQVNWLSDRIRPEIIIDGTSTPLGIFLPATVNINDDDNRRTLEIEAYDQCWLLQDWKTEKMIYAGGRYLTAVQRLLTEAGIGLVAATPNTLSIQNAKAGWEIGTPYLTIINELLAEINYKSIWFNSEGVAILEPATIPDAQHIQHVLDATDPDCLILPGISRSTDVYAAPNVIIVVCEAPEKTGEPLVSKVENINPDSPLSIQARGRRIVKYEKIKGIANQEELDAYANRSLSMTMLSGEVAVLQTALMPGWGVGDVTAVNYGDFQAICVEHSWEMELKVGGAMRHTLERIVTNI